jgi:hypothetical protein
VKPIKEQRESLPIFKLRNELLQAIHDNQVGKARDNDTVAALSASNLQNKYEEVNGA